MSAVIMTVLCVSALYAVVGAFFYEEDDSKTLRPVARYLLGVRRLLTGMLISWVAVTALAAVLFFFWGVSLRIGGLI